MPINQWRGPCRYCGNVVGKRKGLGGRSGVTGRWLVWHGRCEPKAVTPEEKARERTNYSAVARAADAAVPSDFSAIRKPYNDE